MHDLAVAIHQAYVDTFARTAQRPTHARVCPNDARDLARDPFATVDLVDGVLVATLLPVPGFDPVRIKQDPTMIPGCVDVYTPTDEPWLPGSRDRRAVED